MPFIFASQGLIKILKDEVSCWASYGLSYYTSPTTSLAYTRDALDTTAHFIPATGLVGQYVFGSNFGSVGLISSTMATAHILTPMNQTYTGFSNQTIYGFFVNDPQGDLICADSFTPITVACSGDVVRLTSLVVTLTAN